MSGDSKLDQCHEALFGNGDPENCVLVRVANIERKLDIALKFARWLVGLFAVPFAVQIVLLIREIVTHVERAQ